VRHFFPSFQQWLSEVPDPRDQRKTVFPLSALLWEGILLFLLRLRARRRLRFDLNSEQGLRNLGLLSGCPMPRLPHDETVAEPLKRVPPRRIGQLAVAMVRRLLRSRALERFRLLGLYYTIAIDGTEIFSAWERHCEHCLTQVLGPDTTRYHHDVLEAKLACRNGLAFSIGSEFIRNTPGADKQDCEKRSLERLLPRLRQDFTGLPICLLLDSQFLGEKTIAMARRLRMQAIICFKEGSAPAAFAEYEQLLALCPDNRIEENDGPLHNAYRWVNDLEIGKEKVDVLECRETKPDGKITRFVWVTTIPTTARNVRALSQEGGRLRWKIENEGFNVEKNRGFGLEHVFCKDWQAMQCLYFLMVVAHTLSQLTEKGSLLKGSAARLFGSGEAFASRLLEALRNAVLDPMEIERELAAKFQIRLDTS
jgi:hypothetical protein